jgi:6-phosphogluconolactonase/glucosamine-6-phosphate isomerase/deaminase
MNYICDTNTQTLTLKAMKHFMATMQEYSSKPCLVLLSGGSAFSLLNVRLASHFGPQVTIGVLDERYITDASINNFAQLTNHPFFVHAQNAGCSFIDTRVQSGESHQHLAERFEHALKHWKRHNPHGVVVITQGIGPDAHTAGIMPFCEDSQQFKTLFEGKDWVVAYDAEDKNEHPLRVTVTNTFLRTVVDHSIVFAVGGNKKSALLYLTGAQVPLAEAPVQILKEMHDVTVFTDLDICRKSDIV